MKIMIFGRPGSGKTTFAVKLAHKLQLPVCHLDKYFYTANWVERNYQEFMQIQHSLVKQPNWIIDGNNTKSLELRYQHADVVIYFCYPRLQALWRIFKRRFVTSKDSHIDDRAEGCQETISWSLIKYLWTFEDRVAAQLEQLSNRYPQVKFYKVTSDRAAESLLLKLSSSDR